MSIEIEVGLENIDKIPPLPEEPPKRPLAKGWANPKVRALAITGGALLLGTILGVYLHYRVRESTDDAQVDGHIAPVASKIYGNVAEVLVDDNQEVKTGQVLVRVDPRDYQTQVGQARARLAMAESQAHAAGANVPWTRETTSSGHSSAEAELAQAQAEYERARTADLAYARANVEKSRANADLAKADLARYTPLIQKGEISKQQYDAATANAKAAESTWRADEEKLAQTERNVEITRAALVAAHANVAAAQANFKQVNIRAAEASSALAAVQQARATLEAAELQLSYATITAPIDGVVTRRQVEPGQIVQQGQGLLVIVPLRSVYVTANFKETQLAKMKAGQRAYIKVDTYGETFGGRVDSIAGASGARLSLLPPENATGNFVKVVQRIPVKIVLDPAPGERAVLRPGMNVYATVMTD